jgi:hypothetical protein
MSSDTTGAPGTLVKVLAQIANVICEDGKIMGLGNIEESYGGALLHCVTTVDEEPYRFTLTIEEEIEE